MISRQIWRSLLILVIVVLVTSQDDQEQLSTSDIRNIYNNVHVPRNRRAIGKSPGFFQSVGTIGRLVYQQYNDTKSAYGQINDLIQNSFSDTATTSQSLIDAGPNATTTEAPYRISRHEFAKIIARNIRGLIRLFQLEWNDAVNQSQYNIQDHNRAWDREITKIVLGNGTSNSKP